MRTSVHGSGYAPKMDLEGGEGGGLCILRVIGLRCFTGGPPISTGGLYMVL